MQTLTRRLGFFCNQTKIHKSSTEDAKNEQLTNTGARARTIQRRKQLAKIITSLAAPDLRLSKSRKSNWIKSLLAPTPDLQHSAFFLPSTQLINNLSSFPTPDTTKKKIPKNK
jgi:hypothetical protein